MTGQEVARNKLGSRLPKRRDIQGDDPGGSWATKGRLQHDQDPSQVQGFPAPPGGVTWWCKDSLLASSFSSLSLRSWMEVASR